MVEDTNAACIAKIEKKSLLNFGGSTVSVYKMDYESAITLFIVRTSIKEREARKRKIRPKWSLNPGFLSTCPELLVTELHSHVLVAMIC